MLLRFICAAILFLGVAQVGSAQVLQSPILTIDSERFYRDSAFGQSVLREIERRESTLNEENRVLQAELEAEELELTELRKTMAPDEFRALADAFDARVQAIRREREEEARAISVLLDQNRGRFLQAAQPVLEQIMLDAGAAIILEVGGVYFSANVIDITDRAISIINQSVGDDDLSGRD